MLTLAVVDDLVTIVVIAVFFTEDLSFGWLGAAAGLLVVARWRPHREGLGVAELQTRADRARWDVDHALEPHAGEGANP